MTAASDNQREHGRARSRRRVGAALAVLVLWQALALSFHLATERHLGFGDLASGGLQSLAQNAVAVASLDAVPEHGVDAEHPHAPHAAIDHEIAQDRADDDLLLQAWWLPMTAAVTLPRDVVGVAAGAPPTGPPLRRPQHTPIAARAPPLA